MGPEGHGGFGNQEILQFGGLQPLGGGGVEDKLVFELSDWLISTWHSWNPRGSRR